jgi:thiol-disulfide isomerase/thioredoxin
MADEVEITQTCGVCHAELGSLSVKKENMMLTTSDRIWCSHCQAEVPAVQAWIDANGIPEGVEFVSVATSISSARANYPPNAWLEEESWTQRVVMDDEANTLGAVYGLQTFPYYVMLDGSGTVIQRMTGEQDPALIGAILEGLALNG